MPPDQVTYENTTYAKPRNRRVVLWVVVGVVVLILLFVVRWAANQAYLSITIQGQGTGTATYVLTNQDDQKRIEFSTDTTSIKKRVPKGAYVLTVRRGNTNGFSVAQTRGFFSTTEVSTKVESEKGRTFIGQNPKSCMHLVAQTLVSYECDSSMDTLQFHIPATASLPTHNKINPYPTPDVIEGLVRTKEGSVLITLEAAEAGHEEIEAGGGEHSPHAAFLMRSGENLDLAQRTSLNELGERERYAAVPFQDGFIMYDQQTYGKLFYYANLGTKPVSLPITKPNNDKLSPYTLTTRGSSYVLAYQATSARKGQDPKDLESEVVVQQRDQASHYTFDRTFDTVRLCAENRLCGVHQETLYVFDIAGDAPKLLFRVGSVKAIEVTDSQFIVARDKEVLALDVSTGAGSVQYTFGDYRFCGLTPQADTYLLCVSDSRNGSTVLLIDQNQSSDDIDKKITELRKSSEVGALTVYRKYIHVTVDTGTGPVYQNGPGNFSYDPNALKDATDKVRQALDKVGIDQKSYFVKVTAL